MYHAQLDPRMATTETAGGVPVDARSSLHRTATLALYGEESGHQYVPDNVTGLAKTTTLDFVDLECDIVETPGKFSNVSWFDSFLSLSGCQNGANYDQDDWYYNFTSTRTHDGYRRVDYTFFGFNATLFNGTHFLHHKCQAKPATGWCGINLIEGIGVMKYLSCHRERWIEPPSEDPHGPAAGFVALTAAFHGAFEGEASVTRQTHRPQQNSSFVIATARWEDRLTYTMPPSLINHFQRVLWHIPINAHPKVIPDGENVPDGLNVSMFNLSGVVGLNVLDEQPILLQKFNFTRTFAILGACLSVWAGAIIWVILVPKETTERLVQDSLVHSLTVSGSGEPAISYASTLGLDDILDRKGKETLRYRGGHITVE